MYMADRRGAALLEPPEGVAIREVGGAAVGRVLGGGEGPGEVAVRVESSRISHAWSMRARPRCRSAASSSASS